MYIICLFILFVHNFFCTFYIVFYNFFYYVYASRAYLIKGRDGDQKYTDMQQILASSHRYYISFGVPFGIGLVHSITHTSSSTTAFNCS